jgi:Lrp/AsnC family leucine-responsive transcriptional regulator
MAEKEVKCDETDLKILRILQEDCRTPLEKMAADLGVSKSTVHYRIKRLEREGVIRGYFARVDAAKLGINFTGVVFMRGKFGPRYQEKIGKKIASIPGVYSIYFVFGEKDFIVIARAHNREEFIRRLENVFNIEEIERTDTVVVARVLKEDPRVEI